MLKYRGCDLGTPPRDPLCAETRAEVSSGQREDGGGRRLAGKGRGAKDKGREVGWLERGPRGLFTGWGMRVISTPRVHFRGFCQLLEPGRRQREQGGAHGIEPPPAPKEMSLRRRFFLCPTRKEPPRLGGMDAHPCTTGSRERGGDDAPGRTWNPGATEGPLGAPLQCTLRPA